MSVLKDTSTCSQKEQGIHPTKPRLSQKDTCPGIELETSHTLGENHTPRAWSPEKKKKKNIQQSREGSFAKLCQRILSVIICYVIKYTKPNTILWIMLLQCS